MEKFEISMTDVEKSKISQDMEIFQMYPHICYVEKSYISPHLSLDLSTSDICVILCTQYILCTVWNVIVSVEKNYKGMETLVLKVGLGEVCDM